MQRIAAYWETEWEGSMPPKGKDTLNPTKMWLTNNENFVKLERFTGDQFYAYQGDNNLFWETVLNRSVWHFLEHAWSRPL